MLLLAMIVVLVAIFQVPEPIAVGIFLSLLPLTYAACLRSVAAARRGDVFDWQLWNRLMAWAAATKNGGASLCIGRASPALVRVPLLCVVNAAGNRDGLPVFGGAGRATKRETRQPAGRPWRSCCFMPALLATVVGVQLGSPSFPFVATRPVSSVGPGAEQVRDGAGEHAARPIFPCCSSCRCRYCAPSFSDSALQAARAAGAPKAATILLLTVVLPPLITWKGMAESMWLGLTGRTWLSNAFAFGMGTLIGGGTLVAVWIAFYPAVQALLLSLVPWLIGFLLAVKLVLAMWVAARLVHLRLVSGTKVGLMIGGWGLIVTALCLLIVWLVPGNLLSVRDAIAGVVLLVPFSRLAGAPLALDWNRHR